MANTYTGIIAGIGDKSIGANVIPPEFDAQIRNFMAGKNTILSGLYYDKSTGYLKQGYCLAQGYVGGIKEDIAIQEQNYVYGVFTVNHNKEIIDTFEIEIYSDGLSAPDYVNDDILNEAGRYWFQIYPRTNTKKYPYKSEYSDYTNIVLAGGELQNGVTCPTQPVNDNSTKVANTEYVHNQIEEEINAGYFEKTFNKGYVDILGEVTYLHIHIKIIRRAKLCALEVYFTTEASYTTINDLWTTGVIGVLPIEFFPKKRVDFPYVSTFKKTNVDQRNGFLNIVIEENGLIKFGEYGESFATVGEDLSVYNKGYCYYETN